MNNTIDVKQAIENLNKRISSASRHLSEWIQYDEDWMEPSWEIESCFLQLLAIAEILNLSELRRMIESEYSQTKADSKGFGKYDRGGPDSEPYSLVLSRISCFADALEHMFPREDSMSVSKDLLEIIHDIHYVITDTQLFRTAPENETDVHIRIEGILIPVFPDLKHKPTLTKQITNFQPDTGIPSLGTLIEYKFLAAKKGTKRIADEILTDTRGYSSKDWPQIVFVIYETGRFWTEKRWNQLLKESDVRDNMRIVVLSGEPTLRKQRRQP